MKYTCVCKGSYQWERPWNSSTAPCEDCPSGPLQQDYPKTHTNADLMAANNLGNLRVKKRTGGKKRKKGNLRIDVVRRVDVAVWVHCRETTRHAQMYTHPGPVCVCDTFVIDNMSFVHTQMYESSHTHASFIHIVIRHSQ